MPHFHFAGFAAALIAGLVCRVSDGPAGRFAALSVPLGTLLVLAGYFIGDWAELVERSSSPPGCGRWGC